MLAFWHWLVHIIGADYGLPYGHWGWYNFHSGIGGAWYFGVVLTAPLWYYHHTCHDHPMCLRWGKVELAGGAAGKDCYKHHPDYRGKPRSEHRRIRDEMHEAWKKGHRLGEPSSSSAAGNSRRAQP